VLPGRLTVGERSPQLLLARFMPTLCFAVLLSGTVKAAQPQEYEFDIPRQAVATALDKLATQAEVLLLFPYEPVLSVDANPVIGVYSIRKALGILLQDTGFSGDLTEGGVITISRIPSSKNEGSNMKKERKLSFFSKVALFLFGAINVQGAIAQDDDEEEGGVGSMLEEILVTGTSSKTRTPMETSYGVSILNAEKTRRENALGSQDLLDSVPGLFANSSGGEVNGGLSPRGIRGGFNSYVSLQEDGLPIVYSPFFSEYQVRNDLTYGRVETTLGGPSGILTAQGAGAIVNFITYMPETVEGTAKVSVTDYGNVRTDLVYGGPVAGTENWYGSIGGYYRRGEGIKNRGYTGDHGGQLRASLKREFDNGYITFSYKHINDNTTFYVPDPVQTINGGIEPLPGYNPRDDALGGPDTRILQTKRLDGTGSRDLADGQSHVGNMGSVKFEYDFGNGFRIKEHARITSSQTNSHDLRGSGNNSTVFDAATYLTSQQAVLTAAFPTTASVRLVRANDGTVITSPTTLNGNGVLTSQRHLLYHVDYDIFINDFQLTFENDRFLATAGLQYWDVESHNFQVTDDLLTDVKNHAERYDVEALDGTGAVVGHLTDDGVLIYSRHDSRGDVDTISINPYFTTEIQVMEDLRIDGGVRFEYQEATVNRFGRDNFVAMPASLDDPLVLADDILRQVSNGNVTTNRRSRNEIAWTVGGNYKFSNNLAVYARHTNAFDMRNNAFAFFGGNPQTRITQLDFSEIGVRYRGDTIAGYITGYASKNEEVAFRTGANSLTEFEIDNEVLGVEYSVTWRPMESLSLEVSGVIQDSQLVDDNTTSTSLDGNQIDRLPNLQLRFNPTYYFNNGSVYVGVQHYGKRFGDLANTQKLEAYTTVDAGVNYDLNDSLSFSFQGTNLGDELAFSEGNPRGNNVNVGGGFLGYARAIFGRTFTISAVYNF
jgi:iron complex outermembrane recepter protein